jgi:hypothetical protein
VEGSVGLKLARQPSLSLVIGVAMIRNKYPDVGIAPQHKEMVFHQFPPRSTANLSLEVDSPFR